ncbi:MAG TPA: RNA polymerase sigma factor [Bacteroidales bacterium]|nr:RNA polymerase sigma factor [Bacteroidales bacterium]
MTEVKFTEQLLEMEQSLTKYATHFKLGSADSRDLVQETYLKAILNREKFVDNRYLKAWVFTIMRNTFINNYRQNLLHKTFYEHDDESFSFKQTMTSDSTNPDSALSVIEINQKIEQLRECFREPFKMYIAGFRYKEIAEKININIGTVKSRIFLARKLLISQLNS